MVMVMVVMVIVVLENVKVNIAINIAYGLLQSKGSGGKIDHLSHLIGFVGKYYISIISYEMI